MKSVKFTSIKGRNILAAVAVVSALLVGHVEAEALSQSYYTTQSKLADGKWVKVKTSGDGIHQITYDQLLSWGFADPSKVNVFGYGATYLAPETFSELVPDDVVPTYTHHENECLYFYSTSDVTPYFSSTNEIMSRRNYYSTDAYYLLSDIDTEGVPAPIPFVEQDMAVNAHMSVQYVEEELENPTSRGGYFLGREIPVNGALEIPVTIKNMGAGNLGRTNSIMRLGFGALLSNSTTEVAIEVPSSLGGVAYDLNTKTGSATYAPDKYATFKTGYTTLTLKSDLPDGEHVFRAVHPNKNQKYLAADYMWFTYPRLNKIDGEAQLSMMYPAVNSSRNFVIEGEPTVRVLNATSPAHVYEHELRYEDGNIYGSFDRDYTNSDVCRLIAYDIAKPQMEVEFVGEVANQNLHGEPTPDMIILTTPDKLAAAEELADIHRTYDNMDVLVLDHNKVFNEFSSATPEIMAYRRLVKMFYDRDPEKIKYVIMYGQSQWDNRQLVLQEKKDRLLVYETTDAKYSGNSTKAFATDCIIGMVQDNYNPKNLRTTAQDIAVGRIPADDEAAGKSANRKILKYIQNEPSVATYNTVLLMSDDGDSNQHLKQAEELADILTENHEPMTIIRAHNSLYNWERGLAQDIRTVAINTLNRGTGLWLYVGHGSEAGFTAEWVWNRNMVASTSYELPPFGMFATCTVFGIDFNVPTVGGDMLNKEDGGLIGVIAAGRVVYGQLNQQLARSVSEVYARATPGTTIGQIWLEGRNSLIGKAGYSEDYQINTLCYNLGGDPALRITVPDYKIKVSKVSASSTSELSPLSPVTLEGQIVDNQGSPVNDFNGTLTLQLYDSPYVANVQERKKDDVAGQINMDEDLLTVKTADVTDGKFSVTFVSPVPMHESELNNRITLHADSRDNRHADGVYTGFRISTQTESEMIAGSAPTIDFMTVGQEGMPTENLIAGAPLTFIASGTVSDLGINRTSAIGRVSSLTIDGTPVKTAVVDKLRFDDENTWSMTADINSLDAGHHTATLTLFDNAGQRAVNTISFFVGNDKPVSLTADRATVRNNVTFDIEHELGDITASRLVIVDREGNAVVNRDNVSFPVTVNMAQNGDNALADGHYSAYVQLSGSNGRGSSKYVPLVLLKKAE